MQRLQRLSSQVVPILLAVALGACGATRSQVKDGSGTWLVPSPALQLEIDDAAKRLPWTHGMERIDMIQWFARIGEPAYPTLFGLVRDPRKDVAGSALAALGATRDSRLVEHLRAIQLASDDPDLNLERARTLLRLGDWQQVPVLVRGLRDERMVTRALCIQALFESTHERFEYDPKGEPDAREKSVQRWESWVKDRLGDPLLAPTPAREPRESS